jgi:hypothetical protein
MEEVPTPTQTEPEHRADAARERHVGRTIGIVVAVIVVVALVGLALYGLVTHPMITAVLRDVFIIVLALVTIIIGLFMVVLIFQIQSLIALLRNDIKPILESTSETVNTVRGTTTFISDTVVMPMITAASYVTAMRQTVKTLTRSPRSRDHTRRGPQAG